MSPANAAALRLVADSERASCSHRKFATATLAAAASFHFLHAMTATKPLNPAAAPFPCTPYAALHLAPPAPPAFPLAADAASFPPRFPFVTYCCVAPPADHIAFCFPVPPPSSPPVVCKGGGVVPAAAHGLPPHKLMAPFSGLGGAAKKRHAAAGVPVKPWRQHAPANAAAPALVPPRSKPRPAAKAKKASRPRKAAGPRAGLAAKAPREIPPPPKYTTRPPRCWGPVPPPQLSKHTTTVMLRNIPNKLRSGHIIEMLDDHCKLENKAAGAVVSAYDVLYLPMDFRRKGNFGYAFINFTTPAAALRLYFSLQWCGWKVEGSKKFIEIVPAKVQGKEALVDHLKHKKLECEEEEFLPAVFPTPRDGVGAAAAPKRIGRLAARRRTTAAAAMTPAAAAAAPPAEARAASC